MQNILIIGATSALAKSFARKYAAHGANFHLVARNQDALKKIELDLSHSGATRVTSSPFDAKDQDSLSNSLAEAFEILGSVNIVLIAHGSLPNQIECQNDEALTRQELIVNAISVISLLTDISNRLELQKNATIAVITSVAGDRGRQSNYVYGCAKAMISTYLQGLRHRMLQSQCAVNVLDIRPGLIATPMTINLKKGLLWSTPEQVAHNIERAIRQKKAVLYTPFYWRYIMLVIRLLPEVIFKKLSL